MRSAWLPTLEGDRFAEREGFEPSVPCEHARFPSVDLKPLGHLSNKKALFNANRRERDSNPRNPYGFNGFRDRPIQPLSHLSKKHEAKRIRTSDLQIRNLMLYPAELLPRENPERGGFEPPVPFWGTTP